MTVNQRFKTIRENYKLTQEFFGKKLNISQANVTDIERGKVFPNPSIMENLHIKLNINLNWLICGTGKMKENGAVAGMLNEPAGEYGNAGLKDKYIEALEEIRSIRKELDWYLKNCKCANDNDIKRTG